MKNYLYKILIIVTVAVYFMPGTSGQNRIRFNDRELFASGINVAWVDFAWDLDGTPDMTMFRSIFTEIHENGGNSLRLWLHTTGENTPQYDGSGLVTEPGSGAISSLQQILDAAWENEVGLMLCLWSHDMMDISRSAELVERNYQFLTDTVKTRSYIDNALIPMVEAVKGHPGILAWEIFNEPEGFSEEFGWGTRRKVPESAIQRVVNLCAGAIHRTDSTALVTNGTWKMLAMSDVQNLAKSSPESTLAGMSENEKKGLENFYHERYGVNMTAGEIVYKNNNPEVANYNYYRDDRLIAAGGDPDGTLDFYTVHYYSDFGVALSPFNNSKDHWGLDKPLCIGEFYMESDNSISWRDKYEVLYNSGYAGALSWQWWADTRENAEANILNHDRTLESLNYMWENYHEDIVVVLRTGTIYSFKVDKTEAESGDTVTVTWDTEAGSVVTINGESEAETGSKGFTPLWTTTYTLATTGEVSQSRPLTVEYIPSGRILQFVVKPKQLVPGDTVRVFWRTSKGSEAYLNGESVNYIDTVYAVPDENNKTFALDAVGDDPESREITISFGEPGEINRALGADITTLSTDSEIPYNSTENMIDANRYTSWTSIEGSASKIVEFDFLRQYPIHHFKIFWGENGAKSYFLYYSTDANTWEFKHIFFTAPEMDSIALGGSMVRYVRLSLVPADDSTPVSISEIEAYVDPNINDVREESIPVEYELSQNYPNPFNPSTVIKYSLPSRSFVKLNVYDILGRQVTQLVNDVKEAGNYEVVFSTSGLDKSLSSGVYIYRLQAGEYVQTRKMLLLR